MSQPSEPLYEHPSEDCLDAQMMRVLSDTIDRSRRDAAHEAVQQMRARVAAGRSASIPEQRPPDA